MHVKAATVGWELPPTGWGWRGEGSWRRYGSQEKGTTEGRKRPRHTNLQFDELLEILPPHGSHLHIPGHWGRQGRDAAHARAHAQLHLHQKDPACHLPL